MYIYDPENDKIKVLKRGYCCGCFVDKYDMMVYLL